MADIDDALRVDEAPGEPSPRLAASVMEAVRLEREAPPASRRRRMAWVAGVLSLVALLGLLSLAVLGPETPGAAEIPGGTDSRGVQAWVEWVMISGERLLMVTLALAAVILLVRRAERSV